MCMSAAGYLFFPYQLSDLGDLVYFRGMFHFHVIQLSENNMLGGTLVVPSGKTWEERRS